MPSEQWDVAVVGAGPAGCAAAAAVLQQRPSAKLLLMDRQRFPRDKVCGDGIAAEALDVLSDLGFGMDALLDGYPPISRLRLRAPGGAVAERAMHRSVRVIPREVFDGRLFDDVVGRGAVFRQQRVRTVSQVDSGVLIDGGSMAQVVIGADGAESSIRRAVGAGEPSPVALAIRGYATELPDQEGAQLITMSGRNWPAYAWTFPLGNGLANVGYGELISGRGGSLRDGLSRGQLVTRMRDLLPGLATEPLNLRAHRLPLSPGRPTPANGRILLVGDAMSLINPLSGEGIFYAVRSGAAAGLAAVHGEGAGVEYRRMLAAALGGHLRSTDLLARLVRTPRLIDAGVRAAASSQPAFDDLVRLSLGDGKLTAGLLGGIARRLIR